MKTAAAFATNAWRLDPARKTKATFVAANQFLAKKEWRAAGISGWLELRALMESTQ
jgi:hypothetical protein